MNKKNIKNAAITFGALAIMVICSFFVKAQIPAQVVHDPTNLAKIKEVLETGQQQVNKIKEQTSLLKEARDAVSKVNREIMKISTLKNAVSQQEHLLNIFSSSLMDVESQAMSGEALSAYLNRMESYRTQILDNNSLLIQFISDNVFNMSDYERIKAMNDVVADNERIIQQAQIEKDNYEYFNHQLELISKMQWKTIK